MSAAALITYFLKIYFPYFSYLPINAPSAPTR